MGQSERSDEGAERTPPQRTSPDEAGGKFLARLRSQETGGCAPHLDKQSKKKT